MNQATKKIILLSACLLISLNAFANERGRYFHEGDGKLSLVKARNDKKLDVVYRAGNDTYISAALKKINAFFGMPPQLGEDVSFRLIALLDFLQDKYTPGKSLTLLSGYRSSAYNERLRKRGHLAAKTSYHLEGMAADVIFPEIPAEKIWQAVRKLNCCGIGMYGGQSVHVDSGRPRFWTAETALPKIDEPNKNIYLSVDRDIYHPGEKMRLFFSGVSNYPFGVKTDFVLKKGGQTIYSFTPDFDGKHRIQSDCVIIEKRKSARFIYWDLPQDLGEKNNLAIEVGFCGPSYPKMPSEITSRKFEIR